MEQSGGEVRGQGLLPAAQALIGAEKYRGIGHPLARHGYLNRVLPARDAQRHAVVDVVEADRVLTRLGAEVDIRQAQRGLTAITPRRVLDQAAGQLYCVRRGELRRALILYGLKGIFELPVRAQAQGGLALDADQRAVGLGILF